MSSGANVSDAKGAVREFWDRASCGETYAVGESLREQLDTHAEARYSLEPYIYRFAQFASGRGLDVLEVGIGMGADHLLWVRARPRRIVGIDLTERAVAFTRTRLDLNGESSALTVGDAENLPLPSRAFDIVYSWGAIHHSPDTPRAVQEIHRVLRDGGVARVMIYHRWSVVGAMLWLRYGPMRGRLKSLDSIYDEHLESSGTKAYSHAQAKALFSGFRLVTISSELSGGDLMEGAAGQRHPGRLLTIARKVWPRWFLRRVGRRAGLFLIIEAVK